LLILNLSTIKGDAYYISLFFLGIFPSADIAHDHLESAKGDGQKIHHLGEKTVNFFQSWVLKNAIYSSSLPESFYLLL